MNTVQLQVMDPEEAAARQAQILADNEARERRRLAAANRAAGHAKPDPGVVLYVESARGVRGRARHRFQAGVRAPITVVGPDDELKPGCVREHEAELILADMGLLVGARNATEVEAGQLRAVIAQQEAELEKLRSDNARYVREARRGAKDDGQGGPARLRAADKARSDRPDPGSATTTDDFGSPNK